MKMMLYLLYGTHKTDMELTVIKEVDSESIEDHVMI